MRFATAKKYLISASGFALVALIVSPSAYADTYPYLKVFGGDVWAGGWFKDAGNCGTYDATSNSYYQNPSNPAPTPANDNGGILTYANDRGGGSSSEFGAFSLGLIDTAGPNAGFYSDAHTATTTSTKLSFATPNSSEDGGLFEGTDQQAHCIPDYYTSKQVSPTALPAGGAIDVGSLVSGKQYSESAPAGSAISISGTVKNGQHTTIFINGDVDIDTSVNSKGLTYDPYNTLDAVPKFALVVKGNIFVDSNVTQMDGVYISQPDTTSKATTDATGLIWTCYDTTDSSGASNSKDGTWIFKNCNSPLTVNGSLIAKQVNFSRVNSASDVTASSCGPKEPIGTNTAETINYTPAMVIGGPFFNPPPSSTALKIDSLVSLPPLF